MVARIPEPKSVLAVDDDAQALDDLMVCLASLGCNVLSAMTVDDALRITRARKVDAVLIRSRQAGGDDGLQAVEKLLADPGARQTAVVLLHQNNVAGLKEKCAALGCVHPLAEPFEKEQLARTLTVAMARGGFTEVPCCTKPRAVK